MTDATGDLSRYEAPAGELDYPIDCVIGIVPAEHAAGLIDAARAEGVDDDAVRVVPPDRRDDFAVQLHGGGVKGAMRRFISSTGGDLDLVTALLEDLQPGRLAVAIRVGDHDDGLKDRIATAFQQHRGSTSTISASGRSRPWTARCSADGVTGAAMAVAPAMP